MSDPVEPDGAREPALARARGRRRLLGSAALVLAALTVGWGIVHWRERLDAQPSGTRAVEAPDSRSGPERLLAVPPAEPARSAASAERADPLGAEPVRSASSAERAESQGPDAPPFQLTLVTRNALSPDAPVVPGVAVVVGLGAPLDPDCPPLAEVVTDASGRATILIPRDALEAARADRSARLWVRVNSPGRQRRSHGLVLDSLQEGQEIPVIVVPGGNVVGRLLDDQDWPVAGGVQASRWSARNRVELAGSAAAGPDGWFELGLRDEGTYQLLADASDPPPFAGLDVHPEAGTGALRDVDVRFTVPPRRIELHLSGPGALRARVHDSVGRPCAGLAVLVLQAELDDERGSFFLPEPRASELALEGRGRLSATAVTGADGCFAVSGLRNDRYVVRAKPGTGTTRDFPFLLTAAPVAVHTGSMLELVFDHPHLAVRLFGADGCPWAGEANIATIGPSGWGSANWPKVPTLAVAPLLDESFSETGDVLLGGQRVDGGEYVFEVTAERTYLVGLLGGGRPWAPAKVFVPAGASRVDVQLTVADDAPMGRLFLTTRGADRSGPSGGTRLTIEDRTTRAALLSWLSESIGSLSLELPEGSYRAVVEGAAMIDSWHGRVMQTRSLGATVTEFEIAAGRMSNVEAVLPAGARVRLRLNGTILAADRKAILDRFHPGEDMLDHWACRAEILLLARDRRPEPVYFREEWTNSSAAGTHLAGCLSLGDAQTSELLSSGSFTLEARLPGGRVASVPVVLVDGATTEVALTFP